MGNSTVSDVHFRQFCAIFSHKFINTGIYNSKSDVSVQSCLVYKYHYIENFVIFCSLEEKLVKYVGFGRTQRMVILQTCMISHKISVMCGVEWKIFLCIFLEKRRMSEGSFTNFNFLVFLPW